MHSDQFKKLIHFQHYLKSFKIKGKNLIRFKTNNFIKTDLIHVKLNDMKNSIDKNNRQFKSVFSDKTISQRQYSKYPLGEDFYSFQDDDKVLKGNEISQIKVSNI